MDFASRDRQRPDDDCLTAGVGEVVAGAARAVARHVRHPRLGQPGPALRPGAFSAAEEESATTLALHAVPALELGRALPVSRPVLHARR